MTTLTAIPYEHEQPQKRKRWTRSDCDFLERVGLLSERFELLDGQIVQIMGQKRPHIIATTRAFLWLAGVYGNNRVQSQADIEVSLDDQLMNSPQPDVAVLNAPDTSFRNSVRGNDLLLVVEISDSTLRDDLLLKANLYARAGIPEYWVLDVNGRKLYVHSESIGGIYKNVAAFAERESISPLSAPHASVRIVDLLPPALTED